MRENSDPTVPSEHQLYVCPLKVNSLVSCYWFSVKTVDYITSRKCFFFANCSSTIGTRTHFNRKQHQKPETSPASVHSIPFI